MAEVPTEAHKRAVVCRWIGGLFLAPPDVTALAAYRRPEGQAMLDALARDDTLAVPVATLKAETAPGRDLDTAADRFATAFSRAFLTGGRGMPQPYASVWLSERGLLYQAPARAMARLLRETGLALPPGFKEPPDHLGIALDLLATLIEREAAGEPVPVASGAFLADHLLSWVPRFADAFTRLRDPFFYPDLARALATLLAAEQTEAVSR